MNDRTACVARNEIHEGLAPELCAVCGKELDYLTAMASADTNDGMYICFESILQKIFVYGKYLGGPYGAIGLSRYYSKEECARKQCEEEIRAMLSSLGREEYSRFITCTRGNMESIILTRDTIDKRKQDLSQGVLNGEFTRAGAEKKYYCHTHASGSDFTCDCGAELIRIGSEAHRELTGMEDQRFMERYLPGILTG
jgi:hypothetical protein